MSSCQCRLMNGDVIGTQVGRDVWKKTAGLGAAHLLHLLGCDQESRSRPEPVTHTCWMGRPRVRWFRWAQRCKKQMDACHVTHRKFLIIASCCCYFMKIVVMLVVSLLYVGPQFLLPPNKQNPPSLLTLVRAVEGRHGMECEANSKTPASVTIPVISQRSDDGESPGYFLK